MRHHSFGARHFRGRVGPRPGQILRLGGGLFVAAFGVLWTILAFAITADAPFPLVHLIFPLFGVLITLGALTGGGLSAWFAGSPTQPNAPPPQIGRAKCPRCALLLRSGSRFCSHCGQAV